MGGDTALVIVDMQNYYLQPDSSYCRYFNYFQPGCLDYILNRCRNTVIPNIQALVEYFRSCECHVIYLRLCGTDSKREDLHRFFRQTWEKANRSGFHDVYPLSNDSMAEIVDDLRPPGGSLIIDKTTFSPFTYSAIDAVLRERDIHTLVFTGLATSQCVETTARDASDRGFEVIHISDAQADYDENSHNASLFSSSGVCGGNIVDTDLFIGSGARIMSR